MKGQLNKILDIDKKTQEVVKGTEDKIEVMRREFREKVTSMESFAIEDAKKTANDEFDRIIKESEQVAKEKEKQSMEHLKKIDVLYEENEKKLLKTAFDKFILNKDD